MCIQPTNLLEVALVVSPPHPNFLLLIRSLKVAYARGGNFSPQVAAQALDRTYVETGFVPSVRVGR